MAATVGVFVYTGASAATESTVQTGIGFMSTSAATGGTGDSATRSANPVTAGSFSYTKHLRLKATAAPAVSWGAVKVWTDGTGPVDSGGGSNILLRAKGASLAALGQGTGGATPGTGGTTPYNTQMTGDINFMTAVVGTKGDWDTATYSAINTVSKELQLQLQPQAAAAPGPMGQEVINYSYDEV